jgi:hypothetical protein
LAKLAYDLRVAGHSERAIAALLKISRTTLRLRFQLPLAAARARREAYDDEDRLMALRALRKAAAQGKVGAVIAWVRLTGRACR